MDARARILNKRQVPTKDVVLCGETVTVRGLTTRERTKWERASSSDPETSRGLMLVLGVITPEGAPMFTDEDVKALNDQPSTDTEDAVDAILALSAIGTRPAGQEALAALGKDSAPVAGSGISTN
jgi:hypothetical protein